MNLDEKTQEQEAFSRFMHVLECEQTAWREYQILWRSHVHNRDEFSARRWNEVRDDIGALSARVAELRKEWQQIAYPLSGFPLPDDEQQAS